ncbi:hypothetical protein, partial [Limosilactobacillus reuteri]|uniref:hypothetical protein n=1 Tax=Limosilactobacillus reuteri TaxID=1598 RepID=UPI00207C4EC0
MPAPDVKICLAEAQKQLELFKSSNGFEDPKAVVTGGAESSIPAEAITLMVSNIMLGRTEISEGGKKIIQHLRAP